MSRATPRWILRWVHLILAIPLLGYIYSPFQELPNYAPITRYVFVPIIMLAGYWMWRGYVFAIIGVVLWLGAYKLYGVGATVPSQVVLFIAWQIRLMIRGRRFSSRSRRVLRHD